MSREQVIEAALTWFEGRFVPGIRVRLDKDGRIAALGQLNDPVTRALPRNALLPGFINAHSHAFQRGLRGRGERFSEGTGSFWSWREAMYGLVQTIEPEQLYQVCLSTYREMLRCGITTVGEFHYLHHTRSGVERAERDHGLDEAVIRAAADAGIRLVLLFAYYRSGGIGKPLAPAQRRFETASIGDYWRGFDRAASLLQPATQSMGAVAHSIRAATPDEIEELYVEARRRGLVFHMHVEEQRLELLDSETAYQRRPMQLLLERLPAMDGFTAVHCTHTPIHDLREFVRRGGNVCVTPLTEASLGDGIPANETLRHFPRQTSLGSDSNARISMLEEMRWLEYAQRLRYEARGILADPEGAVGRNLIEIATAGGAASLGVEAGQIALGKWGDFCTVNLDAASLAGAPLETLEDALVFGAGDDVIGDVCVGGAWRGPAAEAG